MNEIDEIRLIENEAALDKAIVETQKVMVSMLTMKSEIDRRLRQCQTQLGEFLAYKTLMARK